MRRTAISLTATLMGLAACASAAPDAGPEGDANAAGVPRETLERGREALVESGVKGELRLLSGEPAEWRDSSLGCPQPGLMYAQVITPGYALRFSDGRRTHDVRVAGDNVVICSPEVAGVPKRPGMPVRARELETVIEMARKDLAERLGTGLEQVRLDRFTPTVWPDARLGCDTAGGDSPAAADATPVRGFKLLLVASGQRYTYHTDSTRVMACPPIEAQ